MNRQLIWAVRAQGVPNTRKKLSELATSDDLFDLSLIDTASAEYKDTLSNFEKADELGAEIVTYIDKRYPEKLKNIYQPPAVLYVLGNADILNDIIFTGMVGARRSDSYGIRMAETIAAEIGQTGVGIISGGAIGIDAASHRGALRAKAPTVAVLGSGLDKLYPKENIKLFQDIIENGGAVISEYHFGMEPLAGNFPRRNRIIAGLSTALVVVRAAKRSGSLITASQALNEGVTVFSVPGNIDDRLSGGTNELIRDGAIPLLSPMDVVDELIAKVPDFFVRENDRREKKRKESALKEKELKLDGLSEYEKEIVNIIASGKATANLIEENISFDAHRFTALLGMMEIKGVIKKGPDKKYIIL
ncbi:MAG: DNA-processing protein DprA [Clostridia bacterium]|nr:DNA-processing protein DprA [Clostridia bacterium]